MGSAEGSPVGRPAAAGRRPGRGKARSSDTLPPGSDPRCARMAATSARTSRSACACTAGATSVAKCQTGAHTVAMPPPTGGYRVAKTVACCWWSSHKVAKLQPEPPDSAHRTATGACCVRSTDTSVHRGRAADARWTGGDGVEEDAAGMGPDSQCCLAAKDKTELPVRLYSIGSLRSTEEKRTLSRDQSLVIGLWTCSDWLIVSH